MNKENLQLYFNALSKSYFLDTIEDISDKENEAISIPIQLASAKDTATKFEDSIKHLIYNCYEYKLSKSGVKPLASAIGI